MKTMLTAAMAMMLLAGPLAMADSHHDRGRQDRGHQSNDYRRHGDRHDSHWRHERRDHDRGHDRNRGDRHHFDNRHRDNRHWNDGRWNHRDNRHWNDHRDWRGYSRPPVYYAPAYSYRPYDRHRGWYRGARVPSTYFSSRYIVHDYGAYSLRRPPHGCRWVRVDGDLLLVAIATGLVIDIVS